MWCWDDRSSSYQSSDNKYHRHAKEFRHKYHRHAKEFRHKYHRHAKEFKHKYHRHARVFWHPVRTFEQWSGLEDYSCLFFIGPDWIPACAGMTSPIKKKLSRNDGVFTGMTSPIEMQLQWNDDWC